MYNRNRDGGYGNGNTVGRVPYPQQGGGMSWGGMHNQMQHSGNLQGYRRPGKQELINWFKNYTRANELDLVDESFENYARHICLGGSNVELLPKKTYMFNTGEGQYPMEYYQCAKCGKVILNRNFM